MTEQRSLDEEPIIELTEVVEPSAASDDEIIELTEVVEFPSRVDEEVIELTDIVKSPQVEEEIIELVDVVEEAPPANVSTLKMADTPDADRHATVETPAADLPEKNLEEETAAAPESAAFDLFADTAPEEAQAVASNDAGQNDVLDFAPMDLDIEENKEADLFDSLGMKLEPELQGTEGSDELDFNLSTQELSDAIDLLDAKLAEEPPTDAPGDAPKATALPTTISEAQLENALENVIRKMFADKIDLLINEAIEKNVTAEIEHLKNQLLKDSTED